MPDSTLRELLASGRGSCSAGEDGSVLQRLVDLVRKLPFDLHDCQLDALEAALTGSDFVVRMGTGWGKTLTYLLYVLARAPAVLITPLVALREDQLRELNEWGRRLGFDVAVARPVDAELDGDAEASEDEEEEEEVAALEPVPGKSDPLPTEGHFDPEHGWVCNVCEGCKRRKGEISSGRGLKKGCSAKKQLERAAAAAAAAATAAEAAADAAAAATATPVTDKQGKHRARIAGSPQRMEEEEGSPTASYRLVAVTPWRAPAAAPSAERSSVRPARGGRCCCSCARRASSPPATPVGCCGWGSLRTAAGCSLQTRRTRCSG